MVSKGTIITIFILVTFIFSFTIYAYSSFNVNQIKETNDLEEAYFITSKYNDYTNQAFDYAAPSEENQIGIVLIYDKIPKQNISLNLVNIQTGEELINKNIQIKDLNCNACIEENVEKNYAIQKVGGDYIILNKPVTTDNINNLNLKHTSNKNEITIKPEDNMGNRIYLWNGPFIEKGTRYDPKFNLFWLSILH